MQITYVPPEALEEVWGKCRAMIQKALTLGAGEHATEEWYFQKVKSGDMVMLAAQNPELIACGILSVIEYPKSRVLFIELLAGQDLDAWINHVEPILKKYRDQIGATTIEASCRPGLVKKLTNWRRKAVLMELT